MFTNNWAICLVRGTIIPTTFSQLLRFSQWTILNIGQSCSERNKRRQFHHFSELQTILSVVRRKVPGAILTFMQMNIWKIIHLNCGERYDFMIDHRSYAEVMGSNEECTSLEELKRKTTKGVWVAADLYQLITWLKLYSCVGVKQHIYKLNILFCSREFSERIHECLQNTFNIAKERGQESCVSNDNLHLSLPLRWITRLQNLRIWSISQDNTLYATIQVYHVNQRSLLLKFVATVHCY